MNTTYEQISFITDEQKQDERKNTLRLRERLMTEHGFDAFDDTDILTTVLSYAKGSKDTAGLVNRLFDTFGSLKAILEARPEQLLSVEGMTLSCQPDLSRRAADPCLAPLCDGSPEEDWKQP